MAKLIYHLNLLEQRLHDTRVMLDLTQRDLAQQLNVSDSAYTLADKESMSRAGSLFWQVVQNSATGGP